MRTTCSGTQSTNPRPTAGTTTVLTVLCGLQRSLGGRFIAWAEEPCVRVHLLIKDGEPRCRFGPHGHFWVFLGLLGAGNETQGRESHESTGGPLVTRRFPVSAGTVWMPRVIKERVRRGPQEDLGQSNQSNLSRGSKLRDPQISNSQVLLTQGSNRQEEGDRKKMV